MPEFGSEPLVSAEQLCLSILLCLLPSQHIPLVAELQPHVKEKYSLPSPKASAKYSLPSHIPVKYFLVTPHKAHLYHGSQYYL